MPFNLAAFECAYWAEVTHLARLRGHKAVSPFSKQVAHAVLTSGLLALEDRMTGRKVHLTLASGTGTGKSSSPGPSPLPPSNLTPQPQS